MTHQAINNPAMNLQEWAIRHGRREWQRRRDRHAEGRSQAGAFRRIDNAVNNPANPVRNQVDIRWQELDVP